MNALPTLLAFSDVESVVHWLDGMPWFGWIAIVAIVCGCITSGLAGRRTHRERMEMIRMGMNPDQPAPAQAETYKARHPEL